MDNLRARTLSGLGWSGAAQVARQVLQFFIGVILARLLSPREFGLIGMIIIFTGFANLFSDLGLGAALIQKLDIEQRHLSSVFWVNIAVGIILTGIVVVAAPLISTFYDEPALRVLTMVIALNFFIGSFNVVQNALLRKNMDFQRLARIEIAAGFLAGVLAISMALLGLGVWSLVAQSLMFTAVSVVMMWQISAWRPALSLDTGALKELMGFSSNLLGFNLFNYWIRNFDNILIGKFIGSSALGIYARAYSLMLLPVSQISSVVSRVMFPALSTIQDDTERVKQIYLRSTRTIAFVTFPMMIGLLVVAKPFILSVYGDKWQEVIPILQIFCLTGMGQSVGTTVGWIYTSQGRTDIMLKWGIFSGIVYIISFVIGLRWGVIGVAVAYVLSGYILLWYPAWTIPGRLINLRFSEMIKNLSGPFYCAVAMGVFVWILGLFLPVSWSQWVYLAILVPLGIMLYIAMMHLFKVRVYIETYELIRERW